MLTPKCPTCEETQDVFRAIYYGLPHWVCDGCGGDDGCTMFGLASHLTQWLPFNGEFMFYEGMSYFRALLAWFTGNIDE